MHNMQRHGVAAHFCMAVNMVWLAFGAALTACGWVVAFGSMCFVLPYVGCGSCYSVACVCASGSPHAFCMVFVSVMTHDHFRSLHDMACDHTYTHCLLSLSTIVALMPASFLYLPSSLVAWPGINTTEQTSLQICSLPAWCGRLCACACLPAFHTRTVPAFYTFLFPAFPLCAAGSASSPGCHYFLFY